MMTHWQLSCKQSNEETLVENLAVELEGFAWSRSRVVDAAQVWCQMSARRSHVCIR